MDINIKVKIKSGNIIKRLLGIKNTLKKASTLDDIGEYAVGRLKHYSPESIADGWEYKLEGNKVIVYHSKVEDKVLWYLELGTASHRIEPVSADALHWEESGEDFFSKGHVVSGIKPHLFYTRARQDTDDYIKTKLKKLDPTIKL